MDMSARPYPLEDLLDHSEWLTRLASRLVGDGDEAEDLVQETLIAAARAQPATDRPLRPWLRRVVGNFARLQRRGARRRRQREDVATTFDPPAIPGPDELLARAQMQRQVAELVLGLDEPYRNTLLLRFFEGHASPAIARIQGVADGTVRWRIKEGLDRLRIELDRRHGGDRQAWVMVLAPAALPRAGAAGGAGALKVKGAALLAAAAAVTAVCWLVLREPGDRPRAPAAFTWSVAAPVGLRVFGTPLPAPAGAIAGSVRDPAGAPVAGALITVEARGLPAPLSSGLPVSSAADGTFLVPDLRDGSYRVTASAADWTSAGRAGIEVKGGAVVQGIVLSLGRGGFLLTGRIEDSGQGTIAGALVVARAADGPMRAATDGQGRYRVRLAPGDYNLDAHADGYARARSSVSMAADQTRDFRLDPAARVGGKVVDRESGRAVAGAIVRAAPERERYPLHTTSNEDGHFSFSLPPGRVTFSASRGNRVGFAAEPLLVSAEAAPEVLIQLDPAYTIEGRVVDGGGQALSKARIFVAEGVLDSGTWNGTEMASSDGNGRFVVEGVLPGHYQVFARATGFAPSRSRAVAIRRGPAREVTLALPPAAVVTGRILGADDRPVEGARVQANVRGGAVGNMDGPGRGADQTTTDAEGRFRLGGLGAGSLEVEADHPEHGGKALEPTALAEGAHREVTLRFDRPGSLAGLVRWHDGTPAAGARVRWQPFGRSGRDPVAITSADGRFVIPIARPGSGVVQAELATQTFVLTGGDMTPNKQKVTLLPGSREEVTLTLDRPDATIRGRVLDPEGQPLAGVTVAADPDRGQRWNTQEGRSGRPATTGDDGRFTVSGLQRGTYAIFARDARFPSAQASRVQTDGEEVTLRFTAGATLGGVVVGAGGQPVDTYQLLLVPPESPGRPNNDGSGFLVGVRQSVHAPDGRFRWASLAPGRFDLLVTTADGRATRLPALELRAGERRDDLRLSVAPGATLRGHIVDADSGQPLPGVGVGVQGTEAHVHARSDDDGVFELPAQVPGRTLLLETRPPGAHLSERREVNIPEGQPVVELAPLRLLPRSAVQVGYPRGDVGLRLREQAGAIFTDQVEPSSPAAQADIPPGTQLLAIRGRRLDGLGPVAAQALLAGRPGSTVDLELQTPDGQRRRVTLEHRAR